MIWQLRGVYCGHMNDIMNVEVLVESDRKSYSAVREQLVLLAHQGEEEQNFIIAICMQITSIWSHYQNN